MYKIGIIGLGYVGLPLAVEFAKKYSVVGFDINQARISELKNYCDSTLEIDEMTLNQVVIQSKSELNKSNGLFLTSDEEDLKSCNFYVITVPTPVDKYNNPILKPLIRASETVGSILSKGDYVVYESTVYPGATEEDCLPILEKLSNLKCNIDFFIGYSPERINPGDKKHTLTKIKKVTSGSNKKSAIVIDKIYSSIIEAGTYMASSIKVAEAAKVIENSQRDINIAFVNELAKIFSLLNIDTNEVLKAASSKWNFLPFKPGLVGGHCIGVDPYYLAQKATEKGYNPEIILSGRRINDSMGQFVAIEFIKELIKSGIVISGANVLILGITFKENCPDIRNTGVIQIIHKLKEFGVNITIYDPWASPKEVKREYLIKSVKNLPKEKFDGLILAVAHKEFINLNFDILKKSKNSVLYDVKGVLKNATKRL